MIYFVTFLQDSTNEVKLDMPDIVSGVCPDDEPKTMETIEESDATISTKENTDEVYLLCHTTVLIE